MPLVDQMVYFLRLLEKEPVKLTEKGYLPTKIVKPFVLEAHGAQENFIGKRYSEIDSPPVRWIRLVAELAKFITKRKGILTLSKKGARFLTWTSSHQMIFLFEYIASHVNLGYLDGYEDGGFTQDLLSLVAVTVLEKDAFLSAQAYVEAMLQAHPQLEEAIDNEVKTHVWFQISPKEEFANIVETRILERFLMTFGMIEQEGKWPDKRYRAAPFMKRILTKPSVIEPVIHVPLISGNSMKEAHEAFKRCGYNVDMFFEFFFFSGAMSHKQYRHFGPILQTVLERYNVKVEDYKEFAAIYTQYSNSIASFYSYLLNDTLEEDELMEKMKALSSALFYQLPSTLMPSALFKHFEAIIPCVFDMLASHGVQMDGKDFLENVKAQMGGFVYDKVEHFFMMMTYLGKECKKAKRVSKELTNDMKMLIMGYIVVCWDVMLHEIEESDEG